MKKRMKLLTLLLAAVLLLCACDRANKNDDGSESVDPDSLVSESDTDELDDTSDTEDNTSAEDDTSAEDTMDTADDTTEDTTEDEIIPPPETEENHTHSYITVVITPTCTEQGYTKHMCSCGDSYRDNFVDKKAHNYVATVVAPTCQSRGYTKHSCSVCRKTYTDSYVDGGHKYNAVVTPPSCTAQGYTTHTCSGCGNKYVDTYVAPGGHRYEDTVVPPTVSAQGYTEHKCARCGDSYKTDYVAAITGPKNTHAGWNYFDDLSGTNVEYSIWLPDNYNVNNEHKYFIYIHGHGYGGIPWDNFFNYINGLGFLNAVQQQDCVILIPHLKIQQGADSWWGKIFAVNGLQMNKFDKVDYDTYPAAKNLTDLYALITSVGTTFNVDESKVYVSGSSDGAFATWELITRYTSYFTAAIPFCGATDINKIGTVLKNFPIWFIHGTADTTIPYAAATNIKNALDAAGSTSYKFTAMNGSGHDITSATFKGNQAAAMWSWLFSQSK